jgi:hypothetical protein
MKTHWTRASRAISHPRGKGSLCRGQAGTALIAYSSTPAHHWQRKRRAGTGRNHRCKAALTFPLGANVGFAIAAHARLDSLTDGAPWPAAVPTWRIEDDVASYTVRHKAGNTFTVTSRSRQTHGPSADRLVSPQYVNQVAYERLGNAVYPWSLPYDRSRAEARSVLGELDTTLAEVMAAFAPGTEERRARRPGSETSGKRAGPFPG